MIATPRKGNVPEEFLEFRADIERRQAQGEWPQYRFYFAFQSGGSINMARNALAHHARIHGMDKLLFVDMDVLAKTEHVLRIISHDVPVVGGLYMKRNGHYTWLGRHAGNVECDPKTGLVRYTELPTGFLCIDIQQCLEVMVEKMPEIAFDAVEDPDADALEFNTMHEFFPMGITGPSSWREKFMEIRRIYQEASGAKEPYRGNTSDVAMFLGKTVDRIGDVLARNTGPRIFRGEDYHFSWFCNQLGIPIYADWKCFLHHKGECLYPLNPDFVLNLANKITAQQQKQAQTETKP
jgi:hypothetical protein